MPERINLYDIVYNDNFTFRVVIIDAIMKKYVLQRQRWDIDKGRYIPDNRVKKKALTLEVDALDLRNYKKLNENESPRECDLNRAIMTRRVK